ncbi:predicted protein, partial [Arabidopsis lyrata subsp. lyrata]
GFSSLVGGEAARGLACRTVQGTVACFSFFSDEFGFNSVLVRRDHSLDLRNRWCIAVFFRYRRCSFCGLGSRASLSGCVCLDPASFSFGASCGVTLAPLACSLRLEALGVLVFGAQRFSSVGGLLKVAASSTMVMASPCPLVFVPVASFPVALR